MIKTQIGFDIFLGIKNIKDLVYEKNVLKDEVRGINYKIPPVCS